MAMSKRRIGFWTTLLAAPHAQSLEAAPPVPAARATAATKARTVGSPAPGELQGPWNLQAINAPRADTECAGPAAGEAAAAPMDFTGSRPVSQWPPAWML